MEAHFLFTTKFVFNVQSFNYSVVWERWFFFYRKAGVLLKETKVYSTLVTTPGEHSLVSPKAARSLIYDTSTKVG